MGTPIDPVIIRKLAGAEAVLKQMGVALKSLRLYPPDHVQPSAAVKKLHELLGSFHDAHGCFGFSVGAGPRSGAQILAAEPGLPCSALPRSSLKNNLPDL